MDTAEREFAKHHSIYLERLFQRLTLTNQLLESILLELKKRK